MNHDVVLIGQVGLGSGDAKLGGMILANFLRLLAERETLPKYIILWNEGVKIVEQCSPWTEHLKNLECKGVKIISCLTCLEFLGLEERVSVGEIGNMMGIQEILFTSTVLTV